MRAPTRHMLWLEGRAREGAQEATDASETVEEPERAERPTPSVGEGQEGVQRSWWRRVFGRQG